MSYVRYVTVCHCGHDKASHFEEKHTCLGMLCECKAYADRDKPPPPKPKAIVYPVINPFDDFDNCPDTPRIDTHPTGCTCAVCAWTYGVP